MLKRGKEATKPANKKKAGRRIVVAYISLGIMLAYLAAYLFTHPMAPSFYDDDTTYEMMASWLASGNLNVFLPPYSARLLQIIPIAIFYKIIGINLLSNAMWDIISMLFLTLITFYIGKELHDEYAGLLAALLMCFLPLLISFAATGSETVPMAMLTALAALAFIRGYSKDSSWWYFAAGVSAFASFLASPLGAVMAVTVIVYLLGLTLSRRLTGNGIRVSSRSAHIMSGILFSMLVLFAFDYLRSGNPLLTIEVSVGFAGGPYFIPPALHFSYYRALLFPTLNMSQLTNESLAFYIAIIAAAYLIIKKQKSAYFPIFWFGFGLLYFIIGPMWVSLSPFKYMVIPPELRFLVYISAPMAITISTFIADLCERRGRCRLAVLAPIAAALAFLILTSAEANNYNYSAYLHSMKPEFYLAAYLNALPNSTTIYLPESLPNIQAYMRFDNLSRFILYNRIENCNLTKRYDYIIVENSSNGSIMSCQFWKQVDFLENITGVANNMVYLYRSKWGNATHATLT